MAMVAGSTGLGAAELTQALEAGEAGVTNAPGPAPGVSVVALGVEDLGQVGAVGEGSRAASSARRAASARMVGIAAPSEAATIGRLGGVLARLCGGSRTDSR